MDQEHWLATLRQHRAIAVIRTPHVATGIAMAKAVAMGGFRLIEITWNSDRPGELMQQLRQVLPQGCQVGAGTLLTAQAMEEALTAGAEFCFLPHTNPQLIQMAHEQTIPVVPGALTPTEITLAWDSGASSVKVFPSQPLGGAAYIRHLQGPLGHIPLIPTGGVTVDNGRAFLDAGAIAIGMSNGLFPASLMKRHDWLAIQRRAQAFLETLKSSP